MSVTYGTLTGMRPQAYADSSKDLSAAVTTLATEYWQYETQVVRPLRAQQSWRGGGQPDAAGVAEVNGLAIDTMRLRLAAGAVGYVCAYIGFTLAQQQLAEVRRRIEGDGLTIDADGNVTSGDVPVGDDNGPGSTSAKAQEHQRDLGKVLTFASSIDRSAAHILDVSHEPPVTALTNRPGLLQEARADHENAAFDARQATAILQGLPYEASSQLPGSGDVPFPSVDVPPGASETTLIGAMLLAAGLGTIQGGALGGLTLAGISGGTSTAAGGTVAAGGAVVAVIGGILVVVGGTSLADTTITTTPGTPASPPKSLDDLLQRAQPAKDQTRPGYHPPTKVTSSIKNDPLLTREARKAGRNQDVQRDLDHLTEQLARGNMNPGSGTRSLDHTDVYYARTKDGARLFFRNTDRGIEIVGKSSKTNENAVIGRLQILYGR